MLSMKPLISAGGSGTKPPVERFGAGVDEADAGSGAGLLLEGLASVPAVSSLADPIFKHSKKYQ